MTHRTQTVNGIHRHRWGEVTFDPFIPRCFISGENRPTHPHSDTGGEERRWGWRCDGEGEEVEEEEEEEGGEVKHANVEKIK